MSRERRAAIAFKAHTGWASAVVVAQAGGGVEVVAKGRIAMIDGFEAAAVYHRGHEGGLSAAESRPIIDAAFREAVGRAKKEIAALAASVADRCVLGRAAILAGAGRPLPDLEVVLRSHPLIHTAEGEMYRDVLARACESLGIPVARVPAKDLARRAAAAVGIAEKTLLARLAEVGAASGKPWAAEQRECALAAWAALAARPERGCAGPS